MAVDDVPSHSSVAEAPRWRKRLTVLLIYLVVAFGVTAPAWQGSGLLIGGGDQPDWTGTAWAYWWTGYALTHGMNPFQSSWNFFPVGQYPLSQYNLLDAFLFWPLFLVFGPRLGYNLAALATLISSAIGAHRLARVIGGSRSSALFAGLALETSSFLLLELSHGRLSQALLVFWLLGLAGIYRISRGDASWGEALLTGLCVAASALTYWYFGLFLVFAAVPLWLAEIWLWDGRRWRQILAAAGTALALCLPFVLALRRVYTQLPGVVRELEPWMAQYGDLGRGEFGLSMAINQSHWPFWPLLHTTHDPENKQVALALLALAAAGALSRSLYAHHRWIAVAALGWLLTLGPYVKLTDLVPLRLALPYLWLYDHLPFFSRFWWPQRLEILFLVGAIALAVLFLEYLGRLFPGQRRLLVLLAAGLLLADQPWRNPCFPVEAHPPRAFDERLYGVINGPILTTPVLGLNEISRHTLWLQMFHRQPILGGLGDHIPAHRPPGYETAIRQNRILNALEQVTLGKFKGTRLQPADVDDLLELGFRYAVVDPAAYTPGLEGRWAAAYTTFFRALWGEPMVSSSGGRVWRISRIPSAVQLPAIDAVEVSGPRLSSGRDQPGLTPPSPEDAP